jgi:hypothetical protein
VRHFTVTTCPQFMLVQGKCFESLMLSCPSQSLSCFALKPNGLALLSTTSHFFKLFALPLTVSRACLGEGATEDVHKACKKTVNSCKDQCDYGGMVRDDITVIMLDVDLRGEDLSGSMRGLTPSSSMNSMEGLGVSNVQSIKMLDQRAADEGTEKDKQPKCGCTIQ